MELNLNTLKFRKKIVSKQSKKKKEKNTIRDKYVKD